MNKVTLRNHDGKGRTVMKRLSRQKSTVALMNAKASLAIEGMYLTSQEEQLLLQRVSRGLKNSEFLVRAREIAKNV